MVAPARISDQERRDRLVARHHLGRTAADVVEAVRGVVAAHSSDPITPHLAAWARVPGYTTAQLDAALCEDRTLWRLHAMRRTLFIVPTVDAAVFIGAASRDVARKERAKLERWLEAEMAPADIPGFLEDLEARTLTTMAERTEWRTQDLKDAVPGMEMDINLGTPDRPARSPLSSRVLFLLAMEGHVVRTRPAGSWRSSQYRWSAASTWHGGAPASLDPAVARAELASRYLAAHGPATLVDLRWWTGWTARQATAALEDVGAAAVELEAGGEGYVLADDLDAGGLAPRDGVAVALLPGLDPTPMGWKERDWYLGGHTDRLFDRNGNVGPTVWVDGRVVGGWGQRPGGQVVTELLEDVGVEASALIAGEAAALTEWLGGVVAIPRFRTPLERSLSAGAKEGAASG